MALTNKMVLESARGATIAVHAAAGLAGSLQPPAREAMRLLRAAEGLCRGAVALLSAAPAVGSPGTPSSPSMAARRRARRKAGAGAEQAKDREMKQSGKDDTVMKDAIGVKAPADNPESEPLRPREVPGDGAADAAAALLVDGYMEGAELLPQAPAPVPPQGEPAAAAAERSSEGFAAPAPVSAAGHRVSEAQALAVVRALTTEQLREVARARGGTGHGRRRSLERFLVARRL